MLKRWGMAVEKMVKSFVQTFNLITSSTTGLLEISQTTTLARFLIATLPQAGDNYSHAKSFNLQRWAGNLYALSPTLNKETNLIKDLYL